MGVSNNFVLVIRKGLVQGMIEYALGFIVLLGS